MKTDVPVSCMLMLYS